MAIVAAKCTECGAPIEVNDERKEGYCPFCGTKYITQDIIHNTVNNNYVTNNIDTAVIQGGDTVDAMYERFEAYIKLGDLISAGETVGQMRKKFPQKALTWYCAALYEAERMEDEYKHAREQIDSYVEAVHFPSANQMSQFVLQNKDSLRQYVDGICNGTLQGVERIRPLRAAVYTNNVRQGLDAASKFETAEDRSRYTPLIRRIEESMAGLEKKAAAFDEYAASARRELEARAAVWRRAAMRYRTNSKAPRVIVFIVFAVIAVAVLIGILMRMF